MSESTLIDASKSRRIAMLERVLALLDREIAAVERTKSKKLPRDLCEKLRITCNELRVETGKQKQKDDDLKPYRPRLRYRAKKGA